MQKPPGRPLQDNHELDHRTIESNGASKLQSLIADLDGFRPIIYRKRLHRECKSRKMGADTNDVLETTGSGYAAQPPHYANDFTNMEYPVQVQQQQQQQHLVNNNTSYVYAADPTSYQYYQYTGNVHSPNQYLLHGGTHSPTSADDDQNSNMQHATRASPATIQWLLDNYEPSDGTSLPRCTLYDHYKKHCSEFKLDPVNAASFGKLIRNVFQNLRTRRLGTRGNSKYHYYGIRIKPDSPLNRERIHDSHYGSNDTIISPRQAVKRPAPIGGASSVQPPPATMSRTSSSSPVPSYTSSISVNGGNIMIGSASAQDRASLGDGELPHIDVDFLNGLEDDARKLGLNLGHVCKFIETYKLNCSDVMYCVKSLAFDAIEELWTSFWQPEDNCEDEEPYVSKSSMPDRLSQQQLFSLCTLPQIQSYVANMDLSLYQVVIDILVPDVLMSQMTPLLTQSCRSFAKNAEGFLRKAMQGAPEALQKKKIQAVKYMAQGLRRYTSLNHLAQAAKAVLLKQDQVTAMYNDYIRVDIVQVQEQAGWVCGCDGMLIHQIHNAFKDNLQKMAPMSEWAEWMESIVDQNVQVLSNYHDKPLAEVVDSGKQFLLNWSFYTSMIIRDLTLRSAGSFGSFHLIRLLTDEFMVYLVESRLAKALNRPMIAVMAQPNDYPLFEETPPPSVLPSISLNSHYSLAPRQHLIYDSSKFLIDGNDQHIESQVILSQNGEMLQSTTELL